MHRPKFQIKKNCVLCESPDLQEILNLGQTPIANQFLPSSYQSKNQEFFPLILGICQSCKHIQLLSLLQAELLFSNYPYISQINSTTAKRFLTLAQSLHSRYSSRGTDFLLEIGSNDGSLCLNFQSLGWKVLGVDPARTVVDLAIARGVETICDFFSTSISELIVKERGKPNLIVANNVLAHSDDLRDIFKGIQNLMDDETVLVLEFSYGLNVFQNYLFDTIYHEHMSYHTLLPLHTFLKSVGMRIFDAEPFDAHGGSLRLHVCLISSNRKQEVIVDKLSSNEVASGIYRIESWNNYYLHLMNIKSALKSNLIRLRSLKETIVGYGVPAKFSTLFHFMDLEESAFCFLVDDNPSKQGLYAPGTILKIQSPDVLKENPVDHIVLFSWNYENELSQRIKRDSLAKSSVIIPLPELKFTEL